MKRLFLIFVLILTSATIASAQTTFYYPHVANGALSGFIWKTTIFLTNPTSGGIATGSVTFFKDNTNLSTAGSPLSITFVDESGQPVGNGNTLPFQIAGGESRKYTSTGSGAYTGGFAVVSSGGSVSGTAIFSEFDGNTLLPGSTTGRLIAEAGVPAVNGVLRQAVFVDTIGGYNIGVAYANPNSNAANVTLSLLNSSAQVVMSTTAPLGANNHRAAFISELFQGAPPIAGTLQITSASPLAAIALRFDPSFSVFTTLPPVSLASLLNPAVEWLQQRAWLTPLSSVARLLGAFQLRIG